MAKKGGFLLGAVVGGTAAAIAALLLAPKSGKAVSYTHLTLPTICSV